MTFVREAPFPPTKVADLLPGDVVRLVGEKWHGSRRGATATVVPAPEDAVSWTREDQAWVRYDDVLGRLNQCWIDDFWFSFAFVSRPGVSSAAIVYLHHEPISPGLHAMGTSGAISDAYKRAVSAVKRTQREWPWGKRLAHRVNDGTLSVFWEDV